MSELQLQQLTRTAYLSGLSPAKWRGLVNALVLGLSPQPPDDLIASAICDTALSLLNSFHADSTLKEYLRSAVTDPSFPVHLWDVLPAFLRSVRSATIHDASTMHMICRLILNLHYETQSPPFGSLIPFSALPSEHLHIISDALYLLRLSYEFPASPFHSLTASASELLVLLLTCVGDMSEVSATQATMLLSVVHDVLQVVALQDNVRQALETFLLSLSMLLGDGTKQAEEAETMFASFQMTPGKHDTVGPNPSLDLLSGSLIIGRLVSNRATQGGSGCEPVAVANLIAWYRVSMQTLGVFYEHAILSTLSYLSQISVGPDPTLGFVWRSFILGRMPLLLHKFQERIVAEAGSEADLSDTAAMQIAITQVFNHQDLLDQCEPAVRTSGLAGSDMMEEDTKGGSFRAELLTALVSSGLLDYTYASEMLPSLPHDSSTKLSLEAQEFGVEVEAFIESKFFLDAAVDDTIAFLDRASTDYRSHSTLAEVLYKRFVHTCKVADVEILGRFCKVLSEHDYTLDVISLHAPLQDIIAHALACLEDYDLTTVGDPQTAVGHLGEVVLFLQLVLARYKISSSGFKMGDRVLRSDSLSSTSALYLWDALSENDKATLGAWRKAIFDHSSEGIDDDILRSTKPYTLLRLSATLFSEAIAACMVHQIDGDALKNGVSYYLGPLLNWTLVGVVQALLEETERSHFQSAPHVAVLDAILTDKNCPNVVLRITRQQILKLYTDVKGQSPSPLNIHSLVSRVLKVPPPQAPAQPGGWEFQPRNLVRQALASANTGKVPVFDIERCLAIIGVRAFFDHLWRELLAAASIGKMEICRRFAAFVLSPTTGPTTESPNNIPPLLPIFLHVYVPSLLVLIDGQAPSEQTLSVQLLSAIVISALTFAVNFERAMLKPMEGIGSRDVKVHNLPCSAMARRLRLDLRKARSPSALALFQKLSASSSFISTFPTL